ncbi:MAG: hypothetical protein CMJ77_01515 [Planctomycetaceae bacterium]|nr:hypothetical protein [Planctomycetaceae bacterium]
MNRGLRSVSKTLGLNSPIVAVALFVQWSQITIQLTNWEIPIIKCTHTSSGPFLSNVLRILIDFAHVQKRRSSALNSSNLSHQILECLLEFG